LEIKYLAAKSIRLWNKQRLKKNMNHKITIRPATTADAQVGTDLIYMTMSRLADFLLGSGDPQNAKATLTRLFLKHQNRFSYQFTDIAEVDGQAAGLLLSYPSGIMKNLEIPMALQLLKISGLVEFIRFVHNALPLSQIKEAGFGEQFINNVAVLPTFQGLGIGSQLLAFVEGKAKTTGLGMSSLCVDIDNERARRLYERLGYQVIGTIEFERLSRTIGYKGFHRMAKVL
jgi:ribosomal protein S18 acetylase RimI-like enzyme